MEEKKPDIEISRNFGQDKEGAKEFGKEMSEILKPLKKQGLLDFKKILRRKCDFCDRTIKEGEKFETIGEKDKCENCQKEGR